MTVVSVIGGGRWARTMAGVLCSLPEAPEHTIIHSPRNSAGIAAWIKEKGLGGRISASPSWPQFSDDGGKPDAVIVANQVTDHFCAASGALQAGVAVLIEKPMAITHRRVGQLRDLAAAHGSMLAASHVFLFARYLDAFAELVAAQGGLRSLSFVWTDGQSDIRDGEAKSYDPGVSVFDDILPHMLPMVDRVHRAGISLGALDVRSGGAQVLINGRSGDVDISLSLARNADGRRRIITAETANGTYTLDFSQEPGVIAVEGGVRKNGDPLWDIALRPLGAMMTAFLASLRNGRVDDRLSSEKAAASALFADVVREKYLLHQEQWLGQRIGTAPDRALDYALQEAGLGANWGAISDSSTLRAALAKSALLT